MSKTTVLIADALALVSDALSIALAAYPEFAVYEERPNTGPAAIEAAVRLRPTFVIIDYWLPELNGPVVTRAILSAAPECNIIILSALSSAEQVGLSKQAGAVAFMPKDCSVAQLAEAMRRIPLGEGQIYEDHMKNLLGPRAVAVGEQWQRFAELAPRELEILALLNKGQSTKQIATRLGISSNTVRNYISSMLSKTRSQSASEALAKARACGFFGS